MADRTKDSGIPWKEICLAVGGAAAAGGVAYLVYKQVTKPENPPPLDQKEQSTESQGEKAQVGSQQKSSKQFKDLGNTRFKDGKYEEAIQLYTEALNADPPPSNSESAIIYQNRAASFEKMELFNKVVQDCSFALVKNPSYVKAYIRRGKAYEKLEEHQKALIDLTAACILEQFSNYATMELADKCLRKLSEQKAKQALAERGSKLVPISPTFVESYLISFCEDPTLARIPPPTAFINGDGPDPDPQDADLSEVYALLGKKRYEEVIEACGRVVSGGGESEAEARLVRATFALIRGDSQLVRDDFKALFELLDSVGDNEKSKKLRVNAYIKRGSFHMQQGKKDECLEDFRLAEMIDPENADVFHHRGQLLILMNKLEEAKVDFDKCVQLRPDFALARVQACYADYRLAMKNESFAETNNSIIRFETILKDFPDCSEGYALLGQVYTERQNFADAEEMFNKALELAPTNANIYVHKGLLTLNRSENLDEAISLIKKSLEIDPHNEFAYETLGSVEMQRGNVDEALRCFDRALDLARTELELTHLYSLREASVAQMTVAQNMGLSLGNM